ncbi:MAG: hypothetical protein JRI23_28800, partial [Deltaproteobacteria bacterium]|nr:hypothetical protein [Deltaproteobacteria bacterium]MBW2536113.1 hypothetical protein [Deltaproteobacteria bacterium]
ALLVAVGAVLYVSLLGGEGSEGCRKDADCPADQACVFIEDHTECVPKCDESGGCPLGTSCERCARSGACPHCNTCVAACL